MPSALLLEPHDISIRTLHADPNIIACSPLWLYLSTRTPQLTNILQHIHIYKLDFIESGRGLFVYLFVPLNFLCVITESEIRKQSTKERGCAREAEKKQHTFFFFCKITTFHRVELMKDSGPALTPLASFLKRNNIQKKTLGGIKAGEKLLPVD